jgi:hypothetical protein
MTSVVADLSVHIFVVKSAIAFFDNVLEDEMLRAMPKNRLG